jgi:hypothetical protein
MRTPNAQYEQSRQMTSEVQAVEGLAYSSHQLAYHELASVPVQATDVIDQLHANLQQLADLQSRMKFMMKEIRYLMKV